MQRLSSERIVIMEVKGIMLFKKFGNKYILRIDRGEEVVATLKRFCTDQGITLGSVTAIGAANRATIGLFNTETKQYQSTELTGDFEITSLAGNITTMNGKVYLHLHATLSDTRHHTFGGHLNAAIVSGTCELIIDVIDGACDREFSDVVGLNLLKP
jgi:uncharacterized protein